MQLAIGTYSYTGDRGWTWTPALRRLYGFEGGTIEGFLERVHHGDRDRVRDALEHGARSGAPFGLVHRLADADDERRVVLSGSVGPGETGHRSFGGLAAELGGEILAATRASAQAQLRTALQSHATVDQAKGALMLVYGLDEDQAFDLLRWNSMRLNRKLALIAHGLVDELQQRTALVTETRDALARELESERAPGAPQPARSGSGQSSAVTVWEDALVPLVTVSGAVDLRVARELHGALESTWGSARRRGRIVVDTTDAAWICTASRQVLAGAVRRGARERVALRVVVAPGDPLALRRDLPAEALARGAGTRAAARSLPA